MKGQVSKMGSGCRGICNRYETVEKFRRAPTYTESTCWCKSCDMWLDKAKGLENFRCICCHGKVRIVARASHWLRRKKREL